MNLRTWLDGRKTYLTAIALAGVAFAQFVGWIDSPSAEALYGLLGAGGYAALRAGVARESQAGRLLTTLMVTEALAAQRGQPATPDEPAPRPSTAGEHTGRSIDMPHFTGLLVSPIVLFYGQLLV